MLGEDDPAHLISLAQHNARRKLAHLDSNAARQITNRGKSVRDRIEYSEERERDRDQEKELKFQAGMCFLRGLCFLKRSAFDRARDSFMAAVRIDVQCFEAFEQLMQNSLLSPAEEVAFLGELNFDTIKVDDVSMAQEAAHLTKLLYTTRLSKYASPKTLAEATEDLSTHYNLADNHDLLLTRAETLYTQCRFHEALAITTRILNSASTLDGQDENSADARVSLGHSPNLYPLHVAALYETGAHNTLFHLSHTLATNAPHEAYTYLTIGTYYLSIGKIAQARRFYSKASTMDSHSAPAWIGFAHTFAAEGEHDQAIAAYSTAARLFQGSHLPNLFLGMQHLALNNMQLAWEYCTAAYAMSSGAVRKEDTAAIAGLVFNSPYTLSGDPLVINELGVVLYHQSSLTTAARLFKRSLEVAAELGCDMTAWVATRANLGHALRRMNKLDEALQEFDECLRVVTGGAGSLSAVQGINGRTSTHIGRGTTYSSPSGYEEQNLVGSLHTSRGLVLLSMMNRTQEAVMALHEAVRVLGGDAGGGGVAGTLLSRAMEIWALEESGMHGDSDGEEDEDEEEGDDDEIVQRLPSDYRHRHEKRGTMYDEFMMNGGSVAGRGVVIQEELDQDADRMIETALNKIREIS